MAVFRVERNTGYTVMSNHHLRNKELTLKAKGLLSQMLSLPEDWDYTLAGLSYINRESIDAIRTAVWELEKAGYITRRQGRDEKGKMTAIEYTIYEQPQSPGSHSPGLENPTPGKPILENPTPGNPTSENPTQLNKDILTKEKTNTDLIKYLFLSYPFPNPSPLGQGIAAEPPERKRMEQKRQYKISFAMLRSRTSFLRVVSPCPYRRCNALKSSEKRTLSHNIPYWIESASGLSDCALLVAQQQRRKQSSRTLAQSLSLTTVFGFAICYLSKRNCRIALISCAFRRS